MKQIFVALFFFFYLTSLHAQSNALGVRLNGGTLMEAEISYQAWLGNHNRLEIDAGFGGKSYLNVLKTTAIYQWVFELDDPLLWYVGMGASTGFWDFQDDYVVTDDSGVFLNAAGMIGADYTFEIPLQISFDFKLEYGILNGFTDGFDGGVGFGLRYIF
ncbi:MAG: hypothetical protein ACKVPJ_14120 [Chitinophagales bacterium]